MNIIGALVAIFGEANVQSMHEAFAECWPTRDGGVDIKVDDHTGGQYQGHLIHLSPPDLGELGLV